MQLHIEVGTSAVGEHDVEIVKAVVEGKVESAVRILNDSGIETTATCVSEPE